VYQPLLFFILFATLVPSTLLTYRALKNRSHTIGEDIDRNRPKAYNLVLDTFVGYVELKLANKLTQFRERIYQNQRLGQDLDARMYLYNLLPVRVIEMVAILAVVVIFLYSLLISGDTASLVTTVGLFAAAAYRLMPSVNRILTSLVTMKQHMYTLESLSVFREPEWHTQDVPQHATLPFEQEVSFDHVTFAFPTSTKPVLRDVSFAVRKGEKIGFIGSSGSGKTTLMNLLLRFYTQQQGEIRVDGQPLTLAHTQAWHRLVGYVKQDTFLMDASLRDNITLGEAEPDEQRLRYALEQASLTDFVAGLPQGLDTMAGERGSKLSGGQRQRVGIARAMYKQTQVLVMDEATSALDNQTEREVSEAINKLASTDITILIIAHRITTLRQCDRIFELKDGRIVAVYTYDELVLKHV
jgi:ABC-type multidrug transport system fused ATPase/permease subunit